MWECEASGSQQESCWGESIPLSRGWIPRSWFNEGCGGLRCSLLVLATKLWQKQRPLGFTARIQGWHRCHEGSLALGLSPAAPKCCLETAIAAIVVKERHRRSGNSVLRVCFLLFLVEFLGFVFPGEDFLSFSPFFFFLSCVFSHYSCPSAVHWCLCLRVLSSEVFCFDASRRTWIKLNFKTTSLDLEI